MRGEPLAACLRLLQEASEAVAQAQEVADYQSIGVRCREALLAFANIAQTVMPWERAEEPPKQADLKAWVDHICAVALSGDSHKYLRVPISEGFRLMPPSWFLRFGTGQAGLG